MPVYEIDVGGKTHEIESQSPLSDSQLGDYARTLNGPAKTGADAIPVDLSLKAPPPEEESGWSRVRKEAAAVPKGAYLGAQRTGAALGQLLTEPLGSHYYRDQGKRIAGEMSALKADAPIGAAIGEGAEMAGEAMLPVGSAMRMKSLGDRMIQGGGLGAVFGMGSTPTTSDTKPFAQEKVEQGAMGAVAGAVLPAAVEGVAGAYRAGKRAIFGTPSTQQQELWSKARDMGFDISPSQAKQDDTRRMQAGTYQGQSLSNQKVANEMATAPTGVKASALTPEFFSERFSALGNEYGQIYKPGTALKVDANAIQALKAVVAQEDKIGHPWMVREARQAADRLISEYELQQGKLGTGNVQNLKLKIDAADLQRMMAGLRKSAHAKSGDVEGQVLSEVINDINESVARNHPDLKEKLDILNPKYRTLLTLDAARQKGIVDPQGNISAADLGAYLNRSDSKYRSDKSSNPLQDLGRIGETFGIRGIGQGRTTGGQGLNAGAIGDAVPTTKAGLYRYAMQQGVDNPVGKAVFRNYIKEPNPAPVSQIKLNTAARLGGSVGSSFRLGDSEQ